MVSVEIDNDVLVIRGTDGDESIGIDFPTATSIRVFSVDGTTDIDGPGISSMILPKSSASKGLDIDLGWGPDLVQLKTGDVEHHLNIREARIELDGVRVHGPTYIRAETSREHSYMQSTPSPARVNSITNSRFREFELEGPYALNLTVESTDFLKEVSIDHWAYGENQLNLRDVHYWDDFRITTHEEFARPAWSSYDLIGEGVHEEAPSGSKTFSVESGACDALDGSVMFSNMREGKLDLTVSTPLLSVSVQDSLLRGLNIDGPSVCWLTFKDSFVHNASVNLGKVPIEFQIEDTEFSDQSDFQIGPTGSVKVEGGQFEDSNFNVEARYVTFTTSKAGEESAIDSMNLHTSDEADEVRFEGVDFGSSFGGSDEVCVALGDGSDSVYFKDCVFSYLETLTLDGGAGDDLWFDLGGQHPSNFAEPDRLEQDSIDEGAMSESAAGSLSPTPDSAGPRVAYFAPSRDRARVVFTEPINPASFTSADVRVTYQNGGSLSVSGVRPVPGTMNTAFEITFQTPAAAGYRLQLGPAVLDKAGNPMNADADGVNGEAVADRFVWQDFNGSKVRDVIHGPFYIRVEFDQAIDLASFTAADVVLKSPQGLPVNVLGIRSVPWSERYFDILVAAFPVGGYQLALGPNITDRVGNPMNQDGDAVNGEKLDTYSRVHQDTTAPVLTGVVGKRPFRGITIEFNEAINPATVNKSTMQVINRATGKVVPLTAFNLVPHSDGRRFELRFAAAVGNYELRILTGVRDLFGNHAAPSVTPFQIALLESAAPEAREIEALANLYDVEKFLAGPDVRLTALDPVTGGLVGLAHTSDGPLDLFIDENP
jgi:hypothetical protein